MVLDDFYDVSYQEAIVAAGGKTIIEGIEGNLLFEEEDVPEDILEELNRTIRVYNLVSSRSKDPKVIDLWQGIE